MAALRALCSPKGSVCGIVQHLFIFACPGDVAELSSQELPRCSLPGSQVGRPSRQRPPVCERAVCGVKDNAQAVVCNRLSGKQNGEGFGWEERAPTAEAHNSSATPEGSGLARRPLPPKLPSINHSSFGCVCVCV